MIHGIVLKASNLPRPHKWGLAGTAEYHYVIDDNYYTSIHCTIKYTPGLHGRT